MKIYQITKGQLVTLWAFGLVGWLFSWAGAVSYKISDSLEGLYWFLFIFIPFVLMFYTNGWLSENNKSVFKWIRAKVSRVKNVDKQVVEDNKKSKQNDKLKGMGGWLYFFRIILFFSAMGRKPLSIR